MIFFGHADGNIEFSAVIFGNHDLVFAAEYAAAEVERNGEPQYTPLSGVSQAFVGHCFELFALPAHKLIAFSDRLLGFDYRVAVMFEKR